MNKSEAKAFLDGVKFAMHLIQQDCGVSVSASLSDIPKSYISGYRAAEMKIFRYLYPHNAQPDRTADKAAFAGPDGCPNPTQEKV